MAEEITKKEDELSCVALAPYLTRSRPGWGLPLSGGKKLGSSLLASARLSSVPPPPPVQWGGGHHRRRAGPVSYDGSWGP